MELNSEMELNSKECIYSPNISIKCMLNLEKKALKILDQKISEVEQANISTEDRSALKRQLEISKEKIYSVLISDSEEETHARDEQTINREHIIREALSDTDLIIQKVYNDLQSAISLEATRVEKDREKEDEIWDNVDMDSYTDKTQYQNPADKENEEMIDREITATYFNDRISDEYTN